MMKHILNPNTQNISQPIINQTSHVTIALLTFFCLSMFTHIVHAQKKKLKHIAVLEFVNKTKNQVTSDEVSYLTNEIRLVVSYLPSDEFLVMTKESMMTMIDPNKSLEDCLGQCEVETGRLLNADWIVTGEVLRFGSSLRMSLRLHNTRTGQFSKGASLKGEDVEKLEDAIRIATLRLVHTISPDFKDFLEKKIDPQVEVQLTQLRAGKVNLSQYRAFQKQQTSSTPPKIPPISKKPKTLPPCPVGQTRDKEGVCTLDRPKLAENISSTPKTKELLTSKNLLTAQAPPSSGSGAGWVWVTLGLVSVGVGLAAHAVGLKVEEKLGDSCTDGFCPESQQENVDIYDLVKNVQLGAYITGGITLGIGSILLLSRDSKKAKTARMSIQPIFDSRFVGLQLTAPLY